MLTDENMVKYYADDNIMKLMDVYGTADRQQLYIRKLHMCAFTFDFSDPSKNTREKEMKRMALVDLVDYVTAGAGRFPEGIAEDIIFMLKNNLFRSLPPMR